MEKKERNAKAFIAQANNKYRNKEIEVVFS